MNVQRIGPHFFKAVAIIAAVLSSVYMAEASNGEYRSYNDLDESNRLPTPYQIQGISDETVACLVTPDACPQANANIVKSATDANRGVARPVFSDGDNFTAIATAYEDNVNGSSDEVKELIGRGTESWIANTCVIRVSYALNQSGLQNMRVSTKFYPGLNIISDKANPDYGPYAYRVEEFSQYLVRRYGRPSIVRVFDNSVETVESVREAFRGKKGVILFVVNTWSDATGHFDLWDGDRGDGGEAIHEEYFERSSHIFLWE